MKRMLIGFGLLMAVLSLTAVGVVHWAWPALYAFAMRPRVAFVALPPLPAGSYENPAMWLARPGLADDPTRLLPLGEAHMRQGRAYVFFVHPTTFLGRDRWNAPLDHPEFRDRSRLVLVAMANVYNDAAEIWAPRYRQATFGAFLNDSPQAGLALAIAEGDVRIAFATFLAHVPAGAPIVLAGHGQGALIALRLLRDRVRGTALARRVIAVYLTGWRVSPRHDVPLTGLTACARADQTGCIMAWNTFAEPADPRQLLGNAEHFPALDGSYDADRPLCTNPLTGGVGLGAPASVNRGSMAMGDEWHRLSIVFPSVGARCDPDSGLLMVASPPHLGDGMLPGNNYSGYGTAMFWRNLRGDLALREAAWLRAQARP